MALNCEAGGLGDQQVLAVNGVPQPVHFAGTKCTTSGTGMQCDSAETPDPVLVEAMLGPVGIGSTTGRRSKTNPKCQVPGCNADLSNSKSFYRRYCICELHVRSSSTVIDGQAVRYCQSCTKFHPVEDFEGSKRSCKTQTTANSKAVEIAVRAAAVDTPQTKTEQPAANAIEPAERDVEDIVPPTDVDLQLAAQSGGGAESVEECPVNPIAQQVVRMGDSTSGMRALEPAAQNQQVLSSTGPSGGPMPGVMPLSGPSNPMAAGSAGTQRPQYISGQAAVAQALGTTPAGAPPGVSLPAFLLARQAAVGHALGGGASDSTLSMGSMQLPGGTAPQVPPGTVCQQQQAIVAQVVPLGATQMLHPTEGQGLLGKRSLVQQPQSASGATLRPRSAYSGQLSSGQPLSQAAGPLGDLDVPAAGLGGLNSMVGLGPSDIPGEIDSVLQMLAQQLGRQSSQQQQQQLGQQHATSPAQLMQHLTIQRRVEQMQESQRRELGKYNLQYMQQPEQEQLQPAQGRQQPALDGSVPRAPLNAPATQTGSHLSNKNMPLGVGGEARAQASFLEGAAQLCSPELDVLRQQYQYLLQQQLLQQQVLEHQHLLQRQELEQEVLATQLMPALLLQRRHAQQRQLLAQRHRQQQQLMLSDMELQESLTGALPSLLPTTQEPLLMTQLLGSLEGLGPLQNQQALQAAGLGAGPSQQPLQQMRSGMSDAAGPSNLAGPSTMQGVGSTAGLLQQMHLGRQAQAQAASAVVGSAVNTGAALRAATVAGAQMSAPEEPGQGMSDGDTEMRAGDEAEDDEFLDQEFSSGDYDDDNDSRDHDYEPPAVEGTSGGDAPPAAAAAAGPAPDAAVGGSGGAGTSAGMALSNPQLLPGPQHGSALANAHALLGLGGKNSMYAGISDGSISRLSIKMEGIEPNQVDPTIRMQLTRWLKSSDLDIHQTCVRPGCVHMVVDVWRSPDAGHKQGSVTEDLDRLVYQSAGLLKGADNVFAPGAPVPSWSDVLGPLLKEHTVLVQGTQQVLKLKGDQVSCLSLDQAAGVEPGQRPQLLSVLPLAVKPAARTTLVLQGLGLDHPDIRVFVRIGGRFLDVEVVSEPIADHLLDDPRSAHMQMLSDLPPPDSISTLGEDLFDNVWITGEYSNGLTVSQGVLWDSLEELQGPGEGSAGRREVEALPRVVVTVSGLDTPGLAVVECQLGSVLTDWCPVLVCPDAKVLSEFSELSSQLRTMEDVQGQAHAFVSDLGLLLQLSTAPLLPPFRPWSEPAADGHLPLGDVWMLEAMEQVPERTDNETGQVASHPQPTTHAGRSSGPSFLPLSAPQDAAVSMLALAPSLGSPVSSAVLAWAQERLRRALPLAAQLLCEACDRGWVQTARCILASVEELHALAQADVDDPASMALAQRLEARRPDFDDTARPVSVELWLDPDASLEAYVRSQSPSDAPHRVPSYIRGLILEASSLDGLTLLERALRSGKPAMVCEVLRWAEQCSMCWNLTGLNAWGFTPLHLAAVLPDNGRMALQLMTLLPAVCCLWFRARDASGRTPADHISGRSRTLVNRWALLATRRSQDDVEVDERL